MFRFDARRLPACVTRCPERAESAAHPYARPQPQIR
ncbi:hypothetical protein STAFG_5300 [Streptomyces afghaniensis 772]|uniref:Uncharacterized protein n=1 Tax=Streptomyces afghaniensis 772 TaxID=1283301 RepID=S4MV74_9ACTN|nr:hypothetical protein STAFG_5300 [Streptomyces afghaniensis 772]